MAERSSVSTSEKSRKQSKAGARPRTRDKRGACPRIDRPFAPAILDKAREIANQYTLIIEPEPEVGFFGRSFEMPLVMADARTEAACIRETREALATSVAVMLELGERPPAPARAGKRETQVNIRMNAEEKTQIEEAARRAGFRSISDYMRTAALRQAS